MKGDLRNKPRPCRVCGRTTKVVFNISFEAVPICEPCADTITLQTLGYAMDNYKRLEP